VIVGFLPALGSGLRELQATGQVARLLDGYARPYLAAFERVHYLSYLHESLGEFTDDPVLLAGVRMVPAAARTPRAVRAMRMVWEHPDDVRACAVLRVFQITGVIPALLARWRFGTPYVTTYGFWYAQLSRGGPRRLLKAVLERVGLRYASAVITTTEALRARAARFAPRVELIPNGVDTRRFRPAEIPPDRPGGAPRRVLYVGRLSTEKNLLALVRAAEMLSQTLPVQLAMVGAGPLAPALAAEAAARGVSLELPGVVDQRALPAVYAASDAFVLASFTEGHPKVLLEAMSTGLPCVVSSCLGNRSIVAEGENGLLFDPYRPEALAAALARVLGDATLAATLGKAGRERAVERYDLAALVQREIALVRSVARAP